MKACGKARLKNPNPVVPSPPAEAWDVVQAKEKERSVLLARRRRDVRDSGQTQLAFQGVFRRSV